MSEKDYTLGSGAKMHVTVAPFNDANALVKALARCAKGAALADDVMKTDMGALKDVLIEAVSSNEVDVALFKCLERCSYQDVRINKALFDDVKLGEQARQDYFEICWKAIEANCSPFFEKAFSVLKTRLSTGQGNPKPS